MCTHAVEPVYSGHLQLGTEESGFCREALNKSQCMNLLSAGTNKLAVVERWSSVEVRLYSPSL